MTEQERRRYPRLRANALVRPVGALQTVSARRVNDMSVGGLRVYSDEEHRPGERLEFELLLAGGETITFLGLVVWTERLSPDAPARFDNGIKFLEVTKDDQQRIAALLATTGE